MDGAQALAIAERTRAALAPYCDRIEIAGSIRRRNPSVKDIELVAIPRQVPTGGVSADRLYGFERFMALGQF
jgi:DNA polymerase/3'-5' exonuclease PolX